jgi:hypothetical protein
MRILVDRFIYQRLHYLPSRHADPDQGHTQTNPKIRMKRLSVWYLLSCGSRI